MPNEDGSELKKDDTYSFIKINKKFEFETLAV